MSNLNLVTFEGMAIGSGIETVPSSLKFFIRAKSKKERAVIKTGNIPERMSFFQHAVKAHGWRCYALQFVENGIYFEVVFQ